MKNKYQAFRTRLTAASPFKGLTLFFITLLVCLFTTPGLLRAQITVELNNGGSSSNSAVTGPIYQASGSSGQNGANAKHIFLYTQDELAAAGIFPGAVISSLAWYKANTAVLINNAEARMHIFQRSGVTTTDYPTNVPILEYTDTNSASGNGWEFIGTTIYNMTNNLPAVINWMEVPITPFTYTGGGLEIFVHNLLIQDVGNVTSATLNFRRQSGPNTTIYSINANPGPTSTFSRMGYRPDLLITFKRPANNALVSAVASPTDFCSGIHDIKVELQNNGSNIINNLQIHWTLNGASQTPINWTTPLDTISGTGSNTAIATLRTNYNFAANTPIEIKAWTMLPNGVSVPVRAMDTLINTLRAGLSGSYTIGGSSPNFPDFTSAVDALNAYGVCGPVTMNIRPGDYSGGVTLSNVPGVDATNTITFRSTTANRDDVRITYAQSGTADNFVFKLVNVSNVTLKNLTFEGTGTSAIYTGVMELWDTTSNLTIDSCRLRARNATGNSNSAALMYARSRGSSTLGYTEYYGENLRITNTHFHGGGTALYLYGSTGFNVTFYPDLVFENNVIDTPGAQGLYLYNVKGLKINNNRITTQSGATSPSTQYGMYVQAGIDGGEIRNNKLFIPGTTSSSAAASGIYMNTVGGNNLQPFVVANNEVTVRGVGGSSAHGGIYSTNGSYLRVYNNSVNIIGGSATNMYAGYFSYVGAAYTNNYIYNNVFANSSGGRAMYVNMTGITNLMDYNLIYTSTPGGQLIQKQSSPVATLSSLTAWRAASGWDMNSISYRPPFMDSTDLRPNPADTASWALNGRGMHSPGNNTDINGNFRAEIPAEGVPDIGAHEFKPSTLPPLATADPAAPVSGQTQVFTFGEDTVATITWNGASVPASIDIRQYTSTVAPGFVGADSMYFYTDINAAGSPYDYDARIYYKNPWTGSVKSEAGIRLAEKTVADPWVFYAGTASTTDTVRNTISATGLSTLGFYTGFGEGCSGQPVAPVIVTPALTTTQCPGSEFRIEAIDPDVTSGIVYQWQQAPSSAGPWTNASGGVLGTDLIYETPALTQATYYRLRSTCVASGESVVSTAYEVPIVPAATISSTQSASRCGAGIVTLSATGSAGATMYWYESAAGGALLDTGVTFTTPVLTSTDTFYVAASSNQRRERVASPQPDYVFSNMQSHFGLVFTAHNHVTIHTIDLYPTVYSGTTAAGTIRIYIRDMSNNVLDSSAVYSFTALSDPLLHVVPVEISLPPGQYKMVSTTTGNIRLMSKMSNNQFPYVSPSGAVSILSSTNSANGTSTDYKFFFNWQISVPCESPRQAVTATLGSAPAFAVNATETVCNNGVATLTVTSPAANFDSVTWAPLTGLYANAAGTIPYSGGNSATVYARTTVPGLHTYVATAYNSVTSCGNLDTVRTYVQPSRATATANPPDICVNGSTTLRLDHPSDFATGSIQWQSSPNGISYADIPGAVTPTYPTGLLNATTHFRASIENSAGSSCFNVPLTVTVNQTEVLSSNSVIRCGPDSVTLTAVGSSGAKLKWYSDLSGGTLLDTGTSFTTPFLNNTTTFYVSAEGGKRSNYVGKQYPTIAGTTASASEGIIFDAYVPITLESVALYPIGTGSGTVTIALLTSSGAVLDSTIVALTGTAAPGIKTTVPLNFSVPVGGSMRLVLRNRTGGVTGLIRETVPAASTEVMFPYTISGVASITNGTGSSIITKHYQYFYDWKIFQPCESPRTPVTATITPAPAFTAESIPAVICEGDTAMLTASSANSGYTFEWTPGSHTGGNVPVTPTANTIYYIKAVDNSGGSNNGCVGYDSVEVSINPLPVAILTNTGTNTFCEGDSVLMFASTGAGYTYQWQRNDVDIPGAVNSSFYAKEDGLHTVRVTDVNSCSGTSNPEVITVHPAPEPVITRDGNAVTTGSFSSYQWYLDGALIPGATSQRHNLAEVGSYTVVVTDANGCRGTSEAYQYTGTGVHTLQSANQVRIYPNPATSTVYIETPVPVQVTVSSVDGKVVFQQKGVQQIDISDLSDAVYLIRVADLDGQVLHLARLIKAAK